MCSVQLQVKGTAGEALTAEEGFADCVLDAMLDVGGDPLHADCRMQSILEKENS